MMLRTLAIGLIAASLLTGCAGSKKQEDIELQQQNAQELYDSAKTALRTGNYPSAIKKLEALDSRFPFGPYSQQAQMDLIYAYFKSNDADSALALADRFIRQNPRHPNLDYVYYMRGLVNYGEEVGLLRDALAADLSERDNSNARQSFKDFSELVSLFPQSKYAEDARLRMVHLRNRLADYELHVARYYMQRQSYMGAVNRAKYVVEHFPKTPAVPDALNLMISAYDLLDLPELAEESRRVLKLNFPDYRGRID